MPCRSARTMPPPSPTSANYGRTSVRLLTVLSKLAAGTIRCLYGMGGTGSRVIRN